MKKKALTKREYRHHLSTAAQIRVSAEAFRKEALEYEIKAKAKCAGHECYEAMRNFEKALDLYKKAAKLDDNMFNVVDGDFLEIYAQLKEDKMDNVNPEKIPKLELPLIVFSDHSSGFIQAIIKIRTKGFYNHVMWMHKEGMFASQGNTYSEVPVSRYMKKGNRLKFVQINGLTDVQRNLIVASINKKLKRGWFKNMYDWIGILGQAIGFKKVSTPGLDYCSEDVPRHARALLPYITDEKVKDFISGLPHHGSPEDLNQYMKDNKEGNKLFGRWDSDVEN